MLNFYHLCFDLVFMLARCSFRYWKYFFFFRSRCWCIFIQNSR